MYLGIIRVAICAVQMGHVLARILILPKSSKVVCSKEPSALCSSHECHRPAQCEQPKPEYFMQYRNPGKDTSHKNGRYGHPRYYSMI